MEIRIELVNTKIFIMKLKGKLIKIIQIYGDLIKDSHKC